MYVVLVKHVLTSRNNDESCSDGGGGGGGGGGGIDGPPEAWDILYKD